MANLLFENSFYHDFEAPQQDYQLILCLVGGFNLNFDGNDVMDLIEETSDGSDGLEMEAPELGFVS